MLDGAIVLLVDARILAEYREVLTRGAFGFDAHEVEQFLGFVEASAEHIDAATSTIAMPDEDDRPFWEVAVSGAAIALVTGNRKHYPSAGGLPILTPAELLI